MSQITIVFVGGDSTVDRAIEGITQGDKSHVAVKFDWGIVEALGIKDSGDKYPGVWLHDPDKYDGNPDAEFIPVEIPNLAAVESEARRLIGTLYGYTDCVRGGLYDLAGVELPGNNLTANCSETVTRILRAGGLDILPGVPPDCVTPMDLYREVIRDGQATA